MTYFTTTPKGRCPTCGKCLDCEQRGKMTPLNPIWVGDPTLTTDKYYGNMLKSTRSDFVTTSTQMEVSNG